MSTFTDIPAEIRLEIYHRCDYPTQIVFYEFLILSKAFTAEPPGNRYFTNEEINTLAKYDHPPIIDYFIHKIPDKSYIHNYIHSKISLYQSAINSNSLN